MSTDDRDELRGYVEVWWDAVQSLLALLDDLPADTWTRDTDLPGWTVHDVVAHVAHLEAVLAGRGEETADVGEPPHVRGLMGLYTEIGVVNRRDRTPAELVEEVRAVTAERHERLLADPPVDGTARPDPVFGDVPWDLRLLLRNRPLDVWMHEQDVRRAVDRPGGLRSPAADHTIGYLADGFGFVVGKRVGPPEGTTAVLEVDDAASVAVEVGADGRARPVHPAPPEPTVRLVADRETFVVLAGGRRDEPASAVQVHGDADLGARIVAALATTP